MRAKLLGCAAAVTITACAFVVTASPASAQPWVGPAFVAGGLVAAATSPLWAPGYYDYYPGYAYGPAYNISPVLPAPVVGQSNGDVAYCEAHFRSYNPTTGMYLGYDGLHHSCP